LKEGIFHKYYAKDKKIINDCSFALIVVIAIVIALLVLDIIAFVYQRVQDKREFLSKNSIRICRQKGISIPIGVKSEHYM
jgi:hypothetical protein